ncbi:hypothetical protein UY3_13063 [Chelonia mydas]|uniref:Uncharacterized protein n=1 Tax=Chelonia mydas TaxID=8469 RepID=M7AYN4_CHEMY|nr:hypothetical protein UY3_13063 [Chelonia mydas]
MGSDDEVLSTMAEDFADGEDEEEKEDELGESTEHTILPDSQNLFITLTEIPFQPNEAREGTSESSRTVEMEQRERKKKIRDIVLQPEQDKDGDIIQKMLTLISASGMSNRNKRLQHGEKEESSEQETKLVCNF